MLHVSVRVFRDLTQAPRAQAELGDPCADVSPTARVAWHGQSPRHRSIGVVEEGGARSRLGCGVLLVRISAVVSLVSTIGKNVDTVHTNKVLTSSNR